MSDWFILGLFLAALAPWILMLYDVAAYFEARREAPDHPRKWYHCYSPVGGILLLREVRRCRTSR